VSAQAQDLTIRKSITVECPLEHTFEVFTERIGSWWPLETHSIEAGRTGTPPETAVLEGRVGGRLYERQTDGSEGFWAQVVAWEPPRRLVLQWKVNPDAPAATEIEVRFTPEASGTRVELEHRGWEPFGDKAKEARDDYDSNWLGVLRKFKERAEG
jgi:uncharacterized protein YndB with AHSA1/START domain